MKQRMEDTTDNGVIGRRWSSDSGQSRHSSGVIGRRLRNSRKKKQIRRQR